MKHDDTDNDFFVDANGCLAERVIMDGHDVLVHYRDIPDSDLTTVAGVPCTTALRTVIDVGPEVGSDHLALMVRHCLDRGLFTLDEAWTRIGQPDMLDYPGARVLRQVLSDPRYGV